MQIQGLHTCEKDVLEQIASDAARAIDELCIAANLRAGQILVVGCSS